MAGLGTRHFPASHACKKELFPVVGPDGITRALFHYHLRELDAAGIEEICLIVQPGEEIIRAYLNGPDDTYLKRLAAHPELAREASEMRRLAKRVQFVEQRTQEGYGHAVLQTRVCRRRAGPALPRRSPLSRHEALAVPCAGRHRRRRRRQKRVGGESHRAQVN